jgi:hypothetical protein
MDRYTRDFAEGRGSTLNNTSPYATEGLLRLQWALDRGMAHAYGGGDAAAAMSSEGGEALQVARLPLAAFEAKWDASKPTGRYLVVLYTLIGFSSLTGALGPACCLLLGCFLLIALPFALCPLPIAHCPLLAAHCPLLAARCSLLAAHCSLLTAHCSLLTAHCSLLTAHCSLLTAHRSPLTAHCSLLTAHCSLLTAHCSLLIAHRSPLTAHCSPLSAH